MSDNPFAKYAEPAPSSENPFAKYVDPAAQPRSGVYWKVRPYVAPVVEFAGAAGGSLLGGTAGTFGLGPLLGTTVGGVIGAGLGYGTAEEALELADTQLGGKPPRQGYAQVTEPLMNAVKGGVYEMGGQAAGSLVATGVGKLIDLPNLSKIKAGKITRDALGPDLPAVRHVLKTTKDQGITAAQATANLNSPTWQALADRALARDPRSLTNLEQYQGEESLNALAKLAGGTSAAEVRGTTEAAKKATSAITTPRREAALALANLKPLESEPMVRSINALANSPEFAGNDVLIGALRNLSDDIVKSTDSSGLIDAVALDAIRKNSVSAAIQQLRPNMNASGQRKLAAGVMSRTKPIIDEALGVEYSNYLKEFAARSHKTAEKRLVGEALRLWGNPDKSAFVQLVQNESPDVVEKILGPNKYNIATNLHKKPLGVLQEEAGKVARDTAVKSQAESGKEALRNLLLQDMSWFRFPSYLDVKASTTNKALDVLERKIGDNTMEILTGAMKSPESAVKLLEALPAAERIRVLRLMRNPSTWRPSGRALHTGGTEAGFNMLFPKRDNENKLAK